MLGGKHIVLGVSGSIAAYKAVYLARLCLEAGADVWPVVTSAATRFVGAMTFSALCGHRAITDLWGQAEAGEIGHVEVAHRASLIVLAPATADTIARLAIGRANDPLTAICLAARAPLLIAPAMESGMWQHEATQSNLATLRQRGAEVVAPESGPLGSGREGIGRLAEPDRIFAHVLRALTPQDLKGCRLVVTAGPTREYADPVRCVTNGSTGKMGYAIAAAAWRRGADVVLVSGPTSLAPPVGVRVVQVVSARDMLDACREALAPADAIIMAAAPADHRPATRSPIKLKKDRSVPSLEMTENPDILRELAPRSHGKVAIGFAAETDHVLDNARAKLAAKDLDFIVANDVTRAGAGFGTDTNAVVIIDRAGGVTELPSLPKDVVATTLLDRLAPRLGT